MDNMRLFLFILLSNMVFATLAKAQVINWHSFEPGRHMASLNAGLDYGLTYGAGYARRLNTCLPVALTVDVSVPSGNRLLDEFKVRMGAQVEVVRVGSLSATLRVSGVFRRFENTRAQLLNWGGEFGGIAGYYKPRWFLAGEMGFDKAIVTHVRHSALARENLPTLRDGWYIPTGGNVLYGLQAGASLGKTDLTLRMGRVLQQTFKTSPLLPFYAQVGVNRWF